MNLPGIALLLSLGLLTATTGHRAIAADLAIVIDDVGYHRERGLRAVALPAPITIAILPFTPHSQFLAQQTSQAGKDLIIHQPMEALPSEHVRLEQDTLTTRMSGSEFDATIERAIRTVPQTLGFSNHTGSLLTTRYEHMHRFMRHLNKRGLFFLDSKTTSASVADKVAHELGVTVLKRDVFLDHDRSPEAVLRAYERAIRVARLKGHAILVGHPYPITLAFLERALRRTPADINFVGVGRLVAKRQATPARSQDRANPRISLGQ